jgi:hypothetical protein
VTCSTPTPAHPDIRMRRYAPRSNAGEFNPRTRPRRFDLDEVK